MIKLIRPLGLIMAVMCLSAFQPQPKSVLTTETIKWYTFEDAVKLSETKPKKIFIDVYTDWCGWCKRMDKDTFNDPIIAAYMNKHYYAVKLNAEQRDAINFNGKAFQYKNEYKANELALSLLQGKMSYPSGVFLDEKFGLLTVVQGYQDANGFDPIIKYFAENIYLNKTWEEYQRAR